MNHLQRIYQLGLLTALGVAVLGLLGYIPGLENFGRVRSAYIPMAPSTALSFLVLAGVSLASNNKNISGKSRKVLLILTGLVVLFSFLEVAGYVTGLDLNLENTIIPALGTVGGARIGLMSPATGLLFVLAGLGLMATMAGGGLPAGSSTMRRWGGYLNSTALVGGLTFLLGYLFGTPLFYGSGTVPMALTTAIGFVALGIALVVQGGDTTFPIKHFVGGSTYVRLMRTFIPLLLATVIIGITSANIINSIAGLDYALVGSLFTAFITIVAAAIFSSEARRLSRYIDKKETARRKAELELVASREKYKGLFDSIRDAILVADTERNIVGLNPAFTSIFGYELEELEDKKTVFVYENEHQYKELGEALQNNFGRKDFVKTVNYRKKDGTVFPGETGIYYNKNGKGEVTGFIGLIRDVTARIRIEQEKEALILDLKKALAEVKTLSGLVPICSSCKNIRDDQGYWRQLENYFQEHSDAQFSHGLCPDCAKKLYPDYDLTEDD